MQRWKSGPIRWLRWQPRRVSPSGLPSIAGGSRLEKAMWWRGYRSNSRASSRESRSDQPLSTPRRDRVISLAGQRPAVEVIDGKIGKTFLHSCATLNARLSRRGHPRGKRTVAPRTERVAIVLDPGMVPAVENHQAEADLP